MAEISLTDMFGNGSTQTATEVRISKPGLQALLTAAGYTFTPKESNSVDELLAAFICAGLVALNPDVRKVDPINRNVEFSYDPTLNFDSPTIDGQTYNRHTIEAIFYRPITTPKLNPSDF
jgi:hypothetical protein